MSLIEINEPKISYNQEVIVGIDFGTTNSLVAYSKDNKPFIIKTFDEKDLFPSIVKFNSINIKSIKRYLGKTYSEVKSHPEIYSPVKDIIKLYKEDKFKIHIDNESYFPYELASFIFKELKIIAEKSLAKEVKQAIVTVPAYFDENAKQDIKKAASLAQIDIIRLVSEPVAAAYYYGIENKSLGIYLVYDLGGGTFDTSLLIFHKGVYRVISSSGDNMLGGDDIDHIIVNYLKKKNISISLDKAKKIKEEFLIKDSVIIDNYNFSLSEFENIIKNIISKTINIVKDTINSSTSIENDLPFKISDLKGIILVGGSTKIPYIKKLLKEEFQLPIFDDINPDIIVALGSALIANNLSSRNNDLLLDVNPLSIGIEMVGGIVEKIIPRNTPIPYTSNIEFTTYVNNQKSMKFHIVQGEREFAKDCKTIGYFELDNLTHNKAGKVIIEVTVQIDRDSLTTISAKEKNKNNSKELSLNPNYKLTKQLVDSNLKNAYDHAKDDHVNKQLKEQIISSNIIIENSQILLNCISNINDENVKMLKKITNNRINSLKKSINNSNYDEILENTKLLKQNLEELSDVQLNKNVVESLKGKNINDIS